MEQIAHSKNHIINGFLLKIIGIILMTLDHVGIFMLMYGEGKILGDVGHVFRIIGRLALPLFIFLMVEGVRHTKNYGKYALRLGIISSLLMIGEIIIYYCFDSGIAGVYSPLIDILICSLVIYLINRKDKFSFLVILPLIYIGLSFFAMVYEKANPNVTIWWLPFYARAGYNIFALLLSLGIYFAYDLAKIFLKSGENTANLVGTAYHRSAINVISSLFILVAVFVTFLIEKLPNCLLYSNGDLSVTWASLSVIFILLYNGERGYNKNWFKYGAYLYFPVHIIIIFFIFYLIFM